jgi:dTDP-4-amino-4,6-dideoxygalactose transaminase
MGQETVTWRVGLSDILLGEEEERAVLDVLRSRWLSLGPVTADFEARFADAVGARHAVALCNGTAALHLALLAAGVGPGDEVVVPALTFVATANAVLYCGATPVFADVAGPEDLGMDPEDVARKIGPRTRALLPMHFGGFPCDMDALQSLAEASGLRVVQDAAHAPGALWRGRPIGGLGDAAAWSFFANKNLVCGEGGMVTTDRDEVASFVRLHRAHGMTAVSYDKHRGHAFSYDVVGTGYNYRMTEIQAALGRVQLARLHSSNAVRRERIARYRMRLAGIAGVVVPFAGRDEESACHLMAVVLPAGADRDRVQRELKERGVQTSIHYPPIPRFASFRDRYPADVPRLELLWDRLLTLPLHPLLTEADVDMVCDALREVL